MNDMNAEFANNLYENQVRIEYAALVRDIEKNVRNAVMNFERFFKQEIARLPEDLLKKYINHLESVGFKAHVVPGGRYKAKYLRVSW